MQINLVPGIDLGLAIKWQVIAVFADQDMCEQTRAWTSARNRARGQLSLGESLATGACHARPHNPLHDEVARNIFQLFGDILAQLLEHTAAIAAGITGQEYLFLAFKVVGQRCAIVGAFGRGDLIGIAFGRSLLRLGGHLNLGVFLQIESQLFQTLRLGAETGLAMCCQFLLQLLDLVGLRLDLCRHKRTDSP